ncbi:MAG: catechol 2,3-dioxygenase-like lactoylglutathione lyase family enzyme [Porticoccus sp.]|jgi:catechol 2,3-dioxygenase-like lactoylglutathione lyase family enzyme
MSIITVNNFSHVSTRVSDIEKTLQFYRDTLGLKVIFDIDLPDGIGRAVGCKTPDNGAIEFIELNNPEGGTVQIDGSTDTAMTAFSVDDIQIAHAALKAAGLNPPKPFEVEGVMMMFIPDPDGRNVEIAEFSGTANTVVERHK